MPELPEVDDAARRLSRAARGKTIHRFVVLHPALRRHVAPRDIRRLRGLTIRRVDRRGKHQLLELSDGSTLCVHFRMSGDWAVGRSRGPAEPFARLLLEFSDGTRVSLVDPRALSTLSIVAPGQSTTPELGPDALDSDFGPRELGAALARKRSAIKPALLDQRVVAGIGNIYAVEALWRAKIDPRTAARTLRRMRLDRLVVALREVIRDAIEEPARYSDLAAAPRFDVYDREGDPCRRCERRIRRIVQSGRATYYCPGCQK